MIALRSLSVLLPVAVLAGLLSTATAVEAGPAAYILSNNSLIAIDTARPGTAGAPVAVTGLTAGDTLVGIDFRPQNGFLYGLGFNSAAGTVTVYHVSHRTGQATAVGAPAAFVDTGGAPAPIAGTGFGIDFNPTVDRIRVVTDAGQNFRLDPNTGAPVDGNAAAGIQMDGAINGATTTVDATAYTNNQQNATVTTLYTLSAASNQLFIQNPPNNGTQTVPVTVTLSGAALDFSAANGFDILPGVNVAASNAVATGVGFAALTVGGVAGLYRIDLATGEASLAGVIGNGSVPVQGLAVQGEAVPGGIPAMALSADGTQLLRFNTGSAATAVPVPVTGIVPADVLIGIDWRPQTGQLMGFGADDGADNGTLYRLDPQTGAATAIGTPGVVAFVDGGGGAVDIPAIGAGYGFDFNPTVDRVRVVTGTGLNFRINPNTGAPVDGDLGGAPGSVAGVNTDGLINGGATGVTGAAYTNSFGQSLTGGVTTQYTLDPTGNMLFIQNPPNSGTQTMGLPVTVDFTAVNGFDIPGAVKVTTSATPATGLAYAVLTSGATNLYSIELSTGAATLIGPVGAGGALAGLALGEPGVTLATPPTLGDFDGDGKADLAVFRQSTGEWFVFGSATGFPGPIPLGAPGLGDIPVPADFDGDGKTDLAVFRATTAEWFVFGSATGFPGPVALGTVGDIPVPADYDGDGKADLAVFRPSTAQWFIFGSATGFPGPVALGTAGDIPVPADYDGDGKADLAVYRPSTAQFFVFGSATGFTAPITFGAPGLGDTLVPADFDGDAKADLGVFRTSTGEWLIFGSATGFPGPIPFGAPGLGDIPVNRPAALR